MGKRMEHHQLSLHRWKLEAKKYNKELFIHRAKAKSERFKQKLIVVKIVVCEKKYLWKKFCRLSNFDVRNWSYPIPGGLWTSHSGWWCNFASPWISQHLKMLLHWNVIRICTKKIYIIISGYNLLKWSDYAIMTS